MAFRKLRPRLLPFGIFTPLLDVAAECFRLVDYIVGSSLRVAEVKPHLHASTYDHQLPSLLPELHPSKYKASFTGVADLLIIAAEAGITFVRAPTP